MSTKQVMFGEQVERRSRILDEKLHMPGATVDTPKLKKALRSLAGALAKANFPGGAKAAEEVNRLAEPLAKWEDGTTGPMHVSMLVNEITSNAAGTAQMFRYKYKNVGGTGEKMFDWLAQQPDQKIFVGGFADELDEMAKDFSEVASIMVSVKKKLGVK